MLADMRLADPIYWTAEPILLDLDFIQVRWYGLLFALGFFIGQYIMFWIYRQENRPAQDVEALTLHMVLGTIIGARLGHCLFYQPEIYLPNPVSILYIWEGGLASHGGAAGILLALLFFVNYKILFNKDDKFVQIKREKRAGQSYLWILDRIVIVVALGGGFIRMGNLMNSEIIGKASDLPWAFVFVKNLEAGMIPRHPAQLYEAISCFVLFAVLLLIYKKYKGNLPQGRIFGIFLIWIFGLRIAYEFLKENQVAFENSLPLNMGQLLSIPLVLAGIWLLYRSYTLPQKA